MMNVPHWLNAENPPRRLRAAVTLLLLVILVVFLLSPGKSPETSSHAQVETAYSPEPIPTEVATRNLGQLLDRMEKQLAGGILDSQDRDEVYRLFRLPGASAPQKARDAFYLVLSARLHLLSPTLAAQVRAAADDLVVIDDDAIDGGAYWDHRSKTAQVVLSLPEFLQHTIVEYASELRELEIVAQDDAVWSTDRRLLPLAVSDDDSPLKLQREREALMVQWEYLHNIPQETKRSLLDFCLRLPEFTQMAGAEIVASDLKDSELPLNEYLAVAEEVRGYKQPEVAAQGEALAPMTSDLSSQLVSESAPPVSPPPKHEPRDTDLAPAEDE